MTLRERIENNLTLALLTALFTGFVAGVGAYKAVLEMAQLEVVSKAKLEALQAASNNTGPGKAEESGNLSASEPQEAASTPSTSPVAPATQPRGEVVPIRPRERPVKATSPSVKIRVSGWIDSEDAPRKTLTNEAVDPNFTLLAERKVTNFQLTISQLVNGEICAIANIAPGALGFPAGILMDTKTEGKERLEAGCQVTTTGTVIQCFVDPKRPELC